MLTTFKAKGLVPDTHPLGAGVVGASFSNHTGIAAYKPIVQIDDDHAAIGRFNAVTTDVLGDATLTLTALTDSLGEVKAADQRPDEDYPVWHTLLHNPDWAGYARLCGATGIRVTNRDQLDEAMRALFASEGPALLCVEQDAELL